MDNKIHDELYENLSCLAMIYPTSKEFNNIFKRDMFVKNNKAAFNQVIHYLLSILNPQIIKNKLPSFPPLDLKMEASFRTEALSYINELNSLYSDINLPPILKSHLLSPGGPRFVKFMMKLSQLALQVHLSHDVQCPNVIFEQIKTMKNESHNEDTLLVLNSITAQINKESANLQEEFDATFKEYKNEANEMELNFSRINESISELEKQLTELKSDLENNFDISSINFDNIKEKIESVSSIQRKMNECRDLISYLSNNDCLVEVNENDFVVPEEVSHILSTKQPVNLIKLMEAFVVFLEKRIFGMKVPIVDSVKPYDENLVQLESDLSAVCRDAVSLLKLYNNIALKNDTCTLNKLLYVDDMESETLECLESSNSTLAMPLPSDNDTI